MAENSDQPQGSTDLKKKPAVARAKAGLVPRFSRICKAPAS